MLPYFFRDNIFHSGNPKIGYFSFYKATYLKLIIRFSSSTSASKMEVKGHFLTVFTDKVLLDIVATRPIKDQQTKVTLKVTDIMFPPCPMTLSISPVK